MASEVESLSEEASRSSCWSPPSAEECVQDCGGEPGTKLFIYSLARTVTDADLAPLFAPFNPIYSCVAVGKKGTSRRFGFAKFADQASAAAAREALRGTVLHGKEVDLKFAVALAEPDPASGVQPKLRAKLRAAGQEEGSPRIAARQLQLGQTTPSASARAEAPEPAAVPQRLPCPLPVMPANSAPSASSTPPLDAAASAEQAAAAADWGELQLLGGGAAAPGPHPAAAGGAAGGVPAHLPDAPPPMHHLLVVPHGPGLSHDSIVQLVWCFRPLQISSSVDASGADTSSVLFATLQQAHAAQDAVTQRGAAEGRLPNSSLVSIPLHGQPQGLPPVQLPVPLPFPQVVPPPYQQHAPLAPPPGLPGPRPPAAQLGRQPPHMPVGHAAGAAGPAMAGPASAAGLAAGPATAPGPVPQQAQQQQPQHMPSLQQQPQHTPSLQQQREAVTMRPLYAGPRPAHLRPMHMMPPGYHPGYLPPGAPMHCPPMPQRPAPAPAPAPGPMRPQGPPVPPPYHFLNPSNGVWVPPEGQQQPPMPMPLPQAQAPCAGAPMPTLPESLLGFDGPSAPKCLNPAAVSFSPTKPGRAAAAAAAAAANTGAAGTSGMQAAGQGAGKAQQKTPAQQPAAAAPNTGPPVIMPPVIHSIFSNIEAALQGRSFVPAWAVDRQAQEASGHPLVVAEALEYESGTEDEGEDAPDPREVFAAVNAWNLNTCFVTRTLMRKLAPVELLLKQTAVGDDPHAGAPSVLVGSIVRLLVDKSYKLRQVQGTYVKPETGRLMLVLHDISSPIPAEHISNTCPVLGTLTPGDEAEVLELQAKLSFHGRRLYRHEVAATAWHLQFAEHWQREHGDKTGDELRLATAHLRAMLGDEDEIRWRRRGVHSLDLAQETSAIASSFRLPWNAAANWMNQRSPAGKLMPAFCPGTSPDSAEHSNVTGEYETRAMVGRHEVLAPQVGIHMAPSRAACHSLARSINHPQAHERYMSAALAGSYPDCKAAFVAGASSCIRQPALGTLASGSAFAAAPPSAGSSTSSSEAASLAGHAELAGDAELEAREDDRLLAEAATFGAADEGDADWPPLPASFSTKPVPAAASAGTSPKRGSGAENSRHQKPNIPAAAAGSRAASKAAAATGMQPGGSGRIAAVHTLR